MDQQIDIHPYKRAMKDMTRESIIRFQIMFHCYLNDVHLTKYKLDCLTVLGAKGECELGEFCKLMVEKKIFMSVESSRNTLRDIQASKLIVKRGDYRKMISLHPDMKIQTLGNIWVDIDMLCMENINE